MKLDWDTDDALSQKELPMPETVIHPTPQELTAFGIGKLPEHAAAAVAAHLELCPACRQAVAGVSSDSFLDRVRAAGLAGSSFPPNLVGPGTAPSSAGQPALPNVPCPDIPPELMRHPKYLILRELGRGGMGVVYQARHKEMNRQIVIKVINRSLLDRPDTLERFHREVQAAALLSHPNIVTAYDAEQVGELHILVMEFVPGQSLAEVVQKKGPLPVAYACHFARQVALGLQHAHERKMVHRDIKPQNLMLSLKNQIKILDFGLAKVLREEVTSTGLTSHNAYMGTPDYCAPEQAQDACAADIRADLYSLGCTLYFLLAGRPPFREDTAFKTIMAHMQKEPQPLPELRPDVPAELWQVVKRLLAKEPAWRYQKPSDVAHALVPLIKSGAKRDAKGGSTLPQGMGSPVKGTVIETDSEIEKIVRDVPGKASPKAVPARAKESLRFADQTDVGATPKEVVRAREEEQPLLPAWWKRPGVQAGAFGVSLALILMAAIIIKVKLQTTNGDPGTKSLPAEAIVVLEIDQPGAEIFVDGRKISVHVPGENQPIEIKVEPGRPHKLRISKHGFEAVTQDIELKTGQKASPIKIRLEPEPQRVVLTPPKGPGESSGQPANPTARSGKPEDGSVRNSPKTTEKTEPSESSTQVPRFDPAKEKDLLQAGSVWRGKLAFTSSALPAEGDTSSWTRLCELAIKERNGTQFRGVHSYFDDRWVAEVTGEVLPEGKLSYSFVRWLRTSAAYPSDPTPLEVNAVARLTAGKITLEFDWLPKEWKLGKSTVEMALLLRPGEQEKIRVVNSFFRRGDNDGWTTKNWDWSGNATDPVQVHPADAPEDWVNYWLFAKDRNQHQEWGWHAPAKYHGNHLDKFGKTLKYNLFTSLSQNPPQTDWYVKLDGGGATIFVDGSTLKPPDTGNWKDYRIFLDSRGKWKKFNRDGKPSRPATDDDIKKVLADVTDLRLKGEFGTSKHVGCLGYVIFGADDELHLVPSDKPEPAPTAPGDLIRAGSKWRGKFESIIPKDTKYNDNVTWVVSEREGNTFVITQTGQRDRLFEWKYKGKIQGNQLSLFVLDATTGQRIWEHKDDFVKHFSGKGTIDGKKINVTAVHKRAGYKGTYMMELEEDTPK
jgi:serine/threonine protein kinase